MNKRKLSILSVVLPFVIAVILAACGNEKNDPEMKRKLLLRQVRQM
ncbi:hypothetical protein [Paenibacillus sp. AR247]|nr:hypothetical protein [Paenibacillus sp. AR247]